MRSVRLLEDDAKLCTCQSQLGYRLPWCGLRARHMTVHLSQGMVVPEFIVVVPCHPLAVVDQCIAGLASQPLGLGEACPLPCLYGIGPLHPESDWLAGKYGVIGNNIYDNLC